jgi:sugar phosphate isomerase/epimerase
MQTRFTRRSWLTSTLAGLGAASLPSFSTRDLSAADPIERNSESNLKLSLAAYSFNSQLSRTSADNASASMDLFDFIRFCADLDLDATELTGYYFEQPESTEYLLQLKHECHRLGLDISGTAIGNDFCHPDGPERETQLAMTRDWIDRAAVLGAPAIRIFAGQVKGDDTEEIAIERCVQGIDQSLEYAATKGVWLALENHGGITATADSMLGIVERVAPSPWFGVNLDSGNFHTADPYADLAKIAPYAVNAQIKVSVFPGGEKRSADLERLVAILKEAGYRGYVALEYEEEGDPRTEIPGIIEELRRIIG